jgi:hypothetical protein
LFAADPAAGTWNLNVAKSKFTNTTAPKNATMILEPSGNSLKVTYEEVAPDGTKATCEYAASFDDKDYPICGSGTNWRTSLVDDAENIAVRRAGTNSYSGLFKNAKRVVMTTRMVVGKNGKEMTATTSGADASGAVKGSATVWEKQ